MSIEEYLNQFYTPQTVKSYIRVIEHFTTLHPKAKEYGYSQVIEYLNTRKPNRRILSAIKKYYDYLLDTNQRVDHPCKQLKVWKQRQPIQLQDLFTSEDLELLLTREARYQVLKSRNQAIISLLIYQGLSSENIVRLTIKDLDFEEGTIYIKSTSKLKRRTLELKAKQMNYLYKYLYQDRPKLDHLSSDKLFIGKLGEEYNVDALNRLIRPLKSLFPDRNLHARTIRQSVIANWLNEQKIPLEDVQLLAGHKWLSTTEQYKRDDMEKQRKLINQFHPL